MAMLDAWVAVVACNLKKTHENLRKKNLKKLNFLREDVDEGTPICDKMASGRGWNKSKGSESLLNVID